VFHNRRSILISPPAPSENFWEKNRSKAPLRLPFPDPLRIRKCVRKRGFVFPGGSPEIFLFQPFKYYLYGGDVPCVLAITDNLRAQVHMLRQAALEEAVIHHLSHINGSADGSSTSL